jgi:hypothetical protein
VYTLVILMIISMAVLSIVMISSKNAQQSANNRDYSKSYNTSESVILNNSDVFSNVKLSIAELADKIKGADCRSFAEETLCSVNDKGMVTTIKAFDSNVVENYELKVGEYFDVVLDKGNDDYFNGQLSLEWNQTAAFETSLIYQDNKGVVKQEVDVIDSQSKQVFTTVNNRSNIFADQPVVSANSISFDLGKLNNNNLADLKKAMVLRLKLVSRDYGSSISIRPINDSQKQLPKQVRRIEVLSYLVDTTTGPAPIVIAQFPLSPGLPPFLTQAQQYTAVNSPICGNLVREGGEYCDDGNLEDDDRCPNDCKCPFGLTKSLFATQGTVGASCGNLGKDFTTNDYEMQSGSTTQMCAANDNIKLKFTPGSKLDDLLIMTKKDEPVVRSGQNFILPQAHMIFSPNEGVLNGGDKFYSVAGTNINYSYGDGMNRLGDIGGFRDAGFNTTSFNGTILPSQLESLGFVDADGVARFQFTHITSGCGGADVTFEVVDNN